MPPLPQFRHHCLIYTFHTLLKIDLTVLATSTGGAAWYLGLIHRLVSDVNLDVMGQGWNSGTQVLL